MENNEIKKKVTQVRPPTESDHADNSESDSADIKSLPSETREVNNTVSPSVKKPSDNHNENIQVVENKNEGWTIDPNTIQEQDNDNSNFQHLSHNDSYSSPDKPKSSILKSQKVQQHENDTPRDIDNHEDDTKKQINYDSTIVEDNAALLTDDETTPIHNDMDPESPFSKLRQFYDAIKFFGVIIFNISLFLNVCYFYSSRFCSKYVGMLFVTFIIVRAIFVTLYSWTMVCTTIHSVKVQKEIERQRLVKIKAVRSLEPDVDVVDESGSLEKNNGGATDGYKQADYDDQTGENGEYKKKFVFDYEEDNNFLPSQFEIITSFIALPIVTFAGFGRVILIADDKKHYIIACRIMEVCLHTVPLTLILIFNNHVLGKFEALDIFVVLFSVLNLLEVFTETFIMKGYENKGFNLEEREPITTGTRTNDLQRAGRLSLLWVAITFLMGRYVFQSQGCRDEQFLFDNECLACAEFVDPLCILCDSPVNCYECREGHFVDDGACHDCIDTFGIYALTCDKNEALTCVSDYFVSNGQCVECDTLPGCKEDYCGLSGCTQCDPGYYLDDGLCHSCSDAIPGCSDCTDVHNCISCSNDYLTISQGMCTCMGVGEHLKVNATTGACDCETDYYMTEDGCKTCSGVIDKCFECDLNDDGNGFRLSAQAALVPDVDFLDCDKCNYGYYKVSDTNAETVECLSCNDQWDGCSYCGDDGSACERCLQTHVFSPVDSDVPCTRCDQYLSNCEKCTSSTNCKVCDLGYSRLGGSCVTTPW